MALYPYETQLVVTPGNSDLVVPSAAITIYAPSDTNRATPLTLVDAVGLQLPNPLISSPQGFIQSFQATLPQVMWSGGGYAGYLNSYTGLRDAALAAQLAAETASAKITASLPGGGLDGQFLGKVDGNPAWTNLPVSSGGTGGSGKVDFVLQNETTGAIPARPTSDAKILVLWLTWTEPPRVASGTGGAHPHDVWIRRIAP